jgi:hypothetical protein
MNLFDDDYYLTRYMTILRFKVSTIVSKIYVSVVYVPMDNDRSQSILFIYGIGSRLYLISITY